MRKFQALALRTLFFVLVHDSQAFAQSTACPAPGGASPNPPGPPQAGGYKLKFCDNFRDVNKFQATWSAGWPGEPAPANPFWVGVGPNGLQMAWTKGQSPNDTSIATCNQNATSCTTFRYGYFEARMKWDVLSGAYPAFWMVTKQAVTKPAGVVDFGEIDIFEGQGNQPNYYYGTLNHWQQPCQPPMTGATCLASSNVLPVKLPMNISSSDWHTYGAMWTPGLVTFYLDNYWLGSIPTPNYQAFDAEDFYFVLTATEGDWNGAQATVPQLNLYVDWVRAWQK